MRNSNGQFIKGSKGHLGHKHSVVSLEKMRQASLGKVQSKETIAKRIEKLKGQKRTELQRQNISNSRIGKSNGHSGLKRPIGTGEKISRANLGKPKFKLRGKNHYAWKGGVTPEHNKIRGSIEYRLWFNAVFARDNWTCQKYGTRTGDIVAHHIQNFSEYPELRFAIDNGITLSRKAHDEFHKRYGKTKNTREQLEEFLGDVV